MLQLALMGGVEISQDGEPLAALNSAKAQALLAYLVVTGRSHSRQALAHLLWADLPEEDGRRNLRGVLMKLRQDVEPHLLISHQLLAFNRESDYWLDLESFRKRIGRHPGADLALDSLVQASGLYRGEFLQDLYVRGAPSFDEWVSAIRSQIREQVFDVNFALTKQYINLKQYELGVQRARLLVKLEPVREEGWRHLILLLALSGQRNLALSQYEACRRVLAAELNVEPSIETSTLYERVRSGQVAATAANISSINHNPSVPLVKVPKSQPAGGELPNFIAGPPLTHPQHFFGRERELKRLFHMLKRPPLQNAAIIGPRRSGKTSLMHYMMKIDSASPAQLRPGQKRGWLPELHQIRWIFVDFQDPRLGTSEALLGYMLTQMGLSKAEPCDLESFLDIVSEELDTPTVVMFDEIGVAIQRYAELDDAFWESLRSLATNQVGGNLGFVLASSQPPEELASHSGLGSPFFNIFGYSAHLGPLTDEEARELVASSPIPFQAEDVEWMLAKSGRWPILLQILCRERLMALEEGEQGESWQQEAIRQMAPFERTLHNEHD